MNNYEFCAHFAELLVRDRQHAKILDYGCGRGTTTGLLRARGFDAFGCDVFYGGESWRSEVPAHMLADGIVRDMPDGLIPFDDATFDVVVSNQVLEHVPDLGVVLDEIRRVLRPGGVFLFLFPDRSIWREGHYGVPLLHWFRPGSRYRLGYAAAWRALGFGFHKGTKSITEWSREACSWLDQWTYYRSYRELRTAFDLRFVDFQHHEAFWLVTRFGNGRPWLAHAPQAFQRALVRKWAGMVGTCRKPD